MRSADGITVCGVVTADPDEAAEAVRAGSAVVLIVDPATATAPALLNPHPGRPPGRLAWFVGDPAAPATWQAAQAMHCELFPPTTGG